MSIFDIKSMKDFITCCSHGWDKGWHEGNGGNLSYRLSGEELDQYGSYFSRSFPWYDIGIRKENLAGEYFLVTGSGKHLGDVCVNPDENLCIVEINDEGNCYRKVWGLSQGGVPTSEFPTHFMNHSVRKEITKGTDRVIYHAHVPSIIALSYIIPLDAKAFTRILWKSSTECPVIFPEGIGVIPWMVPGGKEIAEKTSELMSSYSAVIWPHHGMFCSGPSLKQAFGLMDVIEKSADIYLRILMTGKPILQTITDDELLKIADRFEVSLNPSFLEH